jgi:hypothetical protein
MDQCRFFATDFSAPDALLKNRAASCPAVTRYHTSCLPGDKENIAQATIDGCLEAAPHLGILAIIDSAGWNKSPDPTRHPEQYPSNCCIAASNVLVLRAAVTITLVNMAKYIF